MEFDYVKCTLLAWIESLGEHCAGNLSRSGKFLVSLFLECDPLWTSISVYTLSAGSV